MNKLSIIATLGITACKLAPPSANKTSSSSKYNQLHNLEYHLPHNKDIFFLFH